MKSSIQSTIEKLKSGKINVIQATALFEDFTKQADQECRPLLAAGQNNLAREYNELLLQLRNAIQMKKASKYGQD